MSYHWKKQKAQISHTDDWLITYADVITLLLCFFVIIVISTAAKRETTSQKEFKQTVEAKPAPVVSSENSSLLPEIFPGNLPFRPLEQTDFATERVTDNLVPAEADAQPTTPLPTVNPDQDQEMMAALFDAAALTAAILPHSEAPPSPEPPPPQIAPEPQTSESAPFEKKGDRLTSFEMNSAAFFDSGSAILSVEGISILEKVAVKLKSDDLKDYRITVEGHTDDTPIHTAQFASNWELSTARASAVVHFLLDQGIQANKLRAAGYADTFPKAPNRDDKGNPLPANRAENRRVIIKLEKIETD